MTDLGTLYDIQFSTGLSINAKGQIVGNVGDEGGVATLWEDGGTLADLNILIPSNPGLVLYNALYINDSGEIAAQGVLPDGVTIHSFVLTPCDENHPGVEGCDYSMVDAATAVAQSTARPYLPSVTQHLPQSRWSNRYHMSGLQSAGK